MVELWDDLGIQKPDNDRGPAFAFEAGWTATGAVCVAHTRIPENIALARLMAYCPRLSNPPVCDEPSARRAGALLFNRSQ